MAYSLLPAMESRRPAKPWPWLALRCRLRGQQGNSPGRCHRHQPSRSRSRPCGGNRHAGPDSWLQCHEFELWLMFDHVGGKVAKPHTALCGLRHYRPNFAALLFQLQQPTALSRKTLHGEFRGEFLLHLVTCAD